MEPAVRQHLHSVTLRTLQAHSFNRASNIAASALTDVLQQYLTLLAATAKHHAEHSGRTGQGCNVWDVLAALSEVGVEVDELQEFVLGEAVDMKPYAMANKNAEEKERSDVQQEDEEDVVSRRLDSLADIQSERRLFWWRLKDLMLIVRTHQIQYLSELKKIPVSRFPSITPGSHPLFHKVLQRRLQSKLRRPHQLPLAVFSRLHRMDTLKPAAKGRNVPRIPSILPASSVRMGMMELSLWTYPHHHL